MRTRYQGKAEGPPAGGPTAGRRGRPAWRDSPLRRALQAAARVQLAIPWDGAQGPALEPGAPASEAEAIEPGTP